MKAYRNIIKRVAILLIFSLLCGCWDNKEIEDINYVTAIGIDYVDDQYILYIQMLDFTNIAKTESGKSKSPPQVWTGKSTGKTLNQAISNIAESVQERTVLSHISSIIMSEKFLKTDVMNNIDTIHRYYEIRLTPWVFGTKESIEKLMTTKPFYNTSPLKTILHEPLQEYKQKSDITPIQYIKFLLGLTEPATTTLLPNVAIDSSAWKMNMEQDPKLIIEGAHVMSNHKYNGYLTNEELTGLRWMQEETWRSPIHIKKEGIDVASMALVKPKIHKSLNIIHGEPKYHIQIELDGIVTEVLTELTKTELEKEAAEIVKREILDTYRNGLNIHSDVYNLEYLLFKKETGIWKKMKHTSEHLLSERSLDLVTVKVNIKHISMMKLQKNK
ncbi:Ger(x)C family spore germination protein [Paenibacillus faecalis]|uniref:Ger(x)C family spore germination protein n=1 Tax=Paenibacillus faecalis TaxID=2079532 RepID=UPI000D0EF86B|nr:Ger(x)C family spore germination protein [Paenibacillus faecalis]